MDLFWLTVQGETFLPSRSGSQLATLYPQSGSSTGAAPPPHDPLLLEGFHPEKKIHKFPDRATSQDPSAQTQEPCGTMYIQTTTVTEVAEVPGSDGR